MSFVTNYLLSMAILSAVGSGLMAGLLFAFSNFAIKALDRLPPEQAMAAMQFININIINPLFLLVFLGTALLCGILGFYSVWHWQDAASPWLLLGAACYLIGTIGITITFNVPLNNTISGTAAALAQQAWPNYIRQWLPWNHLRTFMSIAATTALTFAVSQLHVIPYKE